MKDTGTFRVTKKKQGLFWVLYFSSDQINNNTAIYCWCGNFLGMLKMQGCFSVDKI